MITLKSTILKGCFLIKPFKHSDSRGNFTKMFNSEVYSDLDFKIREVYHSSSERNVFRGFHFQLPPADHAKIVFSVTGSVTDYVLDLRKHSNTYGQYEEFKLDSNNMQGIYIPRGFAHGFYAHENNSTLVYLVETEYNSKFDTGILWSSVLKDFPQKPIISERDESFVSLDKFKSPF